MLASQALHARRDGDSDQLERLPVAFLCGGQGAQSFQMARALYDGRRAFRCWMNELDALVRPRFGLSVLDLLYDPTRGPGETCDELRLTHPAIFMVEYALGQMLIERFGMPDCIVGASLGELVAATLAGALSLDQALDLLQRHVEVFGAWEGGGGMLAVLADPAMLENYPDLAGACEIATFVDSSHFVVSGNAEALSQTRRAAARRRVGTMDLPVRMPFHSSQMDRYQGEILARLGLAWRIPGVPVISCRTIGRLRAYVDDNLWSIVREPVRLGETLDRLETTGPHLYIDLSPGSVFASTLARRRDGASRRALRILSPIGDDLRHLVRVEAALGSRRRCSEWSVQ